MNLAEKLLGLVLAVVGITVTAEDEGWDDNRRYVRATATFDAAYSAGGETLVGNIDQIDEAKLDELEVVIEPTVTGNGHIPSYDRANDALQLFDDTFTEPADGAADADGDEVVVHVRGRS